MRHLAKRLTPFRDWEAAGNDKTSVTGQASDRGPVWTKRRKARSLAEAADGSGGGSLTTEYPANGSSFLSTQCVKEEGIVVDRSGPRARWRSASVQTLVVKLLRAYGECLGAGSR